MDFDRCQCIAAINASNLALLKVSWVIWSIMLFKRRNVHSKSIEMNPSQERNNARGLSEIAKLLRYDSILDFYSSDESLIGDVGA